MSTLSDDSAMLQPAALSDDAIRAFMRERGAVDLPAGIVEGARERALRPVQGHGPRRLVAAFAMAAIALVAGAAIVGVRPDPAPVTSVTMPLVAPARELLLATYHETATGSEVHLAPADPATALPLDGLEPIPVAHAFHSLLSPDGRTLAVMTWHTDSTGLGSLTLIDLASWRATATPVTGPFDFRGVAWTPDSRGLVWLTPTQGSAVMPTGRGFQVVRWDVGSPAVETILDLPDPAFMPMDARMVGPSAYVVYGQQLDTSSLATDLPHVLIVDLATLSLTADLALTGFEVGPRQDGPELTDLSGDEAAVAWDPSSERLLIATRGLLARVDVPTATLSIMPIAPRTSFVDVMLDLFGAPAAAKSFARGEVLTGAVAPGGGRLFLTGILNDPRWRDDVLESVRQDPLGLRVVDPQDGALIATVEGAAGQVAVSPVGDRLLVSEWTTRRLEDGTFDQAPGGVALLDARTLDRVAWVPPMEGATVPFELGTSWDGRYGYLAVNLRTAGGGVGIEVIDLRDGTLLHRRTLAESQPLVALLRLGS